MFLTKKDLSQIKGVVRVEVETATENLAVIVNKGFQNVEKRFEDMKKRFDGMGERLASRDTLG